MKDFFNRIVGMNILFIYRKTISRGKNNKIWNFCKKLNLFFVLLQHETNTSQDAEPLGTQIKKLDNELYR